MTAILFIPSIHYDQLPVGQAKTEYWSTYHSANLCVAYFDSLDRYDGWDLYQNRSPKCELKDPFNLKSTNPELFI